VAGTCPEGKDTKGRNQMVIPVVVAPEGNGWSLSDGLTVRQPESFGVSALRVFVHPTDFGTT
jgi:hypothetical protein